MEENSKKTADQVHTRGVNNIVHTLILLHFRTSQQAFLATIGFIRLIFLPTHLVYVIDNCIKAPGVKNRLYSHLPMSLFTLQQDENLLYDILEPSYVRTEANSRQFKSPYITGEL